MIRGCVLCYALLGACCALVRGSTTFQTATSFSSSTAGGGGFQSVTASNAGNLANTAFSWTAHPHVENGASAHVQTSSFVEVHTPKISIADQLRAAAFASDRRAVADILTENSDIPMLVEGFSFEPQDRAFAIRRTADRESDSDVTVMKGLAQSALDDVDGARKLAEVFALSIATDESWKPKVIMQLEATFRNCTLMKAIVAADPSRDFLPPTGRRRLTCSGCTAVNSMVCASCWPRPQCRLAFWCSG